MGTMRGILLFALVASACSFSPGAFVPPGDVAPDGPPPITVYFAKATTMADESSAVVQVRVLLSQASDAPITASYAVSGGTATPSVDFTGGTGTLSFAPQDIEEIIEVTITPDALEESNETIELTLSNVSGTGAGLGASTHTITISANVLPRVTFQNATSMGPESTSPTINAVLNVASPLTTSVQVAVMSGTATGGGVDYTLTTTTVTFAPNQMTQPVTLSVVDDTRDEPNETVTLELTNPSNLIVGAQGTTTHTIEDNDNPPTVFFAAASSQISESGTMTNLVVTLSPASGKTVSVTFAADAASTATVTSDYTFGTASPLTFAPGETTKMIQVNIVDDTAVEGNETVIVGLTAATDATIVAPSAHTLTIVDNDATCVGTGATAVCFPAPTAAATISGTFDTANTNSMCASAAPLSGWTGGPDSCFVVATNVTINATTVTGPRPLVVIASGTITVAGDVDASSHIGGTSGPGASTQTCTASVRLPVNSTAGAGGGAGGTFRTKGGDGGDGNNASASNGIAAAVEAAPTVLRAGCRGDDGGKGNSGGGNNAGLGGLGGGAIYLAAVGTITINNNVLIHANGAGADAQTTPNFGFQAGGGGGGSGGMIKLFAPTLIVSGARLMANGGGGSSGGDNDTAGDDGTDPALNNVTNSGVGGNTIGDGGSGGNGFGGAAAATNGADAGSNNAGGGGGGGGGLIQSNGALTGAQTSAGEVVTN
jgi:hypothetical protein